MNISFSKKYNNADWHVKLLIYNNNISLTSPDQIEETNGSMIPPESILSIQIQNSIIDFVPTVVFQVIDNKYAITNYLKNQNCKLILLLSRPLQKQNDNEKSNDMTLSTIVKEYDVINFDNESITYRISCELTNSIPLNTLCEYATKEPENPYEIAYKILKNCGYSLFPIETKSEKGTILQTKYCLPSTDYKCNFITNQNMTVLNAIKYLFSAGAANSSEPAYLVHNLLYDRGFITSRRTLMRKDWLDTQPGVTKIDFNFSSSDIGETHIMSFLSTKSALGGIEHSKLYNNYEFFSYNHLKREWDSNLISKNNLNDTLTKFIDVQQEKSLFDTGDLTEDPKLSLKYQFPPINDYFITDVKRNLDLYSSNLQFTVLGDLELDVGLMINIDETRGGNQKIEQFSGVWMISKILHTFSDQMFKTNMIVSRVSYKKNLTTDVI